MTAITEQTLAWRIVSTETAELWGARPTGVVVAMYRFRRNRWEFREGFGERWVRCAAPVPGNGLDAELVDRLPRMS